MGHRRDINGVSLPSLKQKHIPKSKPADRCLGTELGTPIGHRSDVTLLQNGKSKQLCERERENERSGSQGKSFEIFCKRLTGLHVLRSCNKKGKYN